MHGWLYDIHSFLDVVPLLASTGYRVIVPYVHGYVTTRFLSSDTLRNGQPSALAVDTIAFITLQGDPDGAPRPDPSSYAKKFTGKYSQRLIEGGIGHNLPQEARQAFARAVVEVDRL